MLANKELFTPAAIVIAALIIGGAIVYSADPSQWQSKKNPATSQETKSPSSDEGKDAPQIPIGDDDHIRGNKNAVVTIVEFSDLECPFCKRFHSTLQQALADYGDQVRWVYKHFPIDQLHSKADKEAEAAECAGELGGNEKFWAYLDRIFEITPSNNGLDLAVLPQIAKDLGLGQKAFEDCLNSGKYAEKVERQYQEGVKLGVNGTPGSFVNDKPVRGAVPYEQLKAIIDAELQ